MSDNLVSLVRQVGPRDHLRYPELEHIRTSLRQVNEQANWSVDQLLDVLGDHAGLITLSKPEDDGGFRYCHFGAQLVKDAGFDMTGRSTAEFDTATRNHIEPSFYEALNQNAQLTTIMPGSPGSDVVSWQRFVFPVDLADGRHVLSMVIPLMDGASVIHARPSNVCIGVIPLRPKDDRSGYDLVTPALLESYVMGAPIDELEAFVGGVTVPDESPDVGTLMAATTMHLTSPSGLVCLVSDVVHGLSTPYLVVANVTGSAMTHQQLTENKHLLKGSFELGKLGSWINHGRPDGRIRIAEELADLLGLSIDRDGLIQLDDIRALFDDDLLEATKQAVATCWEIGESYVVEGGVTPPHSKRLQMRISGSPMRDESGRIIGLFGLMQDISSEHATQQELLESQERFRDFATSAGDWCWETDEEHRFIDFTRSSDPASQGLAVHYVGKTRREIPIIDEDQPALEVHFEDLAARRDIHEFQYRLHGKKPGDVLTIQVSGKPRFAADGTFLGYRGTARNITDKVAADQERRENQLALGTAQSIARLGYWITDIGGRDTRWSSGLLGLLGFEKTRNDPSGAGCTRVPQWRDWLSRIHRADRSDFMNAIRRARQGQDVEPLDVRYFKPDARQPEHFRVMLRFRATTEIHSAQLMGVVQDVTSLKRAQEELEQRSETLSEAQELGGIGDWQFDSATGQVIWSKNLYSILGLDPAHFVPSAKSVLALCQPAEAERVQEAHRAALAGDRSSRIDVQATRGDGTAGYYTMMTKPLYDDEGGVYGLFGTVQDITERKRAEKQLRNLAYFDPLTGLANRALFSRHLRDVFSSVHIKGGSAALFLLDLDHFKEVNDTLGHDAGDELLRAVGRTLKQHVDDRGFVTRLGGDEFAVIVRDYASVDSLYKFAQTIIDKLTGILKLERGEVLTGTSLGISLIPQDGGSAEEALRNADLALYMAKDEGRGKALFFKPEMSYSVQARLNLARDLRFAIEHNHLETRYQGQIDLKTGKVAAFETLVRWNHPERGYISPAEFIPVAESSSLICDIGLWVLRDACRTGRAWLDAGEPKRMISVNVSAAQIWQSDFEDDVLAIVKETGFPPDLLCLELTESVFADHGEGRVRKALARFKEVGIKLAVDDFGTGYSSLGYLNDLPFNELKIDRCFVAGIHEAPDKARLLQGIIALGQGLGMSVVAEGAEEQGEIDLLRAYGCDYVQGFVYMRPETEQVALKAAEELEFQFAQDGDYDLPIPLQFESEALKKAG